MLVPRPPPWQEGKSLLQFHLYFVRIRNLCSPASHLWSFTTATPKNYSSSPMYDTRYPAYRLSVFLAGVVNVIWQVVCNDVRQFGAGSASSTQGKENMANPSHNASNNATNHSDDKKCPPSMRLEALIRALQTRSQAGTMPHEKLFLL